MKHKKKFSNSLMKQMSWILALLLFFFLAVYLLAAGYSVKMLRRNTLEMNETILSQTEDRIGDCCDTLYDVATVFSQSPSVLQYFSKGSMERTEELKNLTAAFSNTLLLNSHILSVILYDTQMEPIACMGKSFEIPYTQRYMRTDMKIETAYLDALHAAGEELYFEIFYPVFDLSSSQYRKAIGVCVFVAESDIFEGTLENSRATKGTSVFLLDSADRTLAFAGEEYAPEILEEMRESSGKYFVQERELEESEWRLVSVIPKEDLRNPDAGMWMISRTIFAAAIVLFLLLVVYYYRWVIRPIEKIHHFIRRITEHPEERLEMERQDEIGNVAESLDRMLDENQKMQEEIQVSQRKMYETELAKRQAELLAYRNQVNPHFLYNTFACICDMAVYYEIDDIARLTRALSNVFRFAVKGEDKVTVGEEIAYIEEYAKIIHYRFSGKINVEADVQEGLQMKKIFKLLLQPLVENAVFHGLEQKRGPGLVEVEVTAPDAAHLCFTVTDDGCGIEPERLENILQTLGSRQSTDGIGISNIYQRLRMFYGEAFSFQIESIYGKGTSVRIIIPDMEEEEGE